MLFFVIWVIVVIVALALLMTYNIIAFRKNEAKPNNKERKNAKEVKENAPPEAAPNHISDEEKTFDYTVKEEKSDINDNPSFVAEQKSVGDMPSNDTEKAPYTPDQSDIKSDDKDYRRALRELMSGQTAVEEKAEEEKASSDSEYREALRSLSKKQ
ncbi:cytoskeletal protein RodZ [Scopulibacillus daqui]|uniref:Cytoskeletal protein RodZ n=1 Tax=Scopulibacillus daqui TaxID=1469162 RepID=A0ABS2Q1I0_9BACL|nr:hypothetical protein [Scopulibacillus daqui]MBM7646152.1 cytoskeletal protein RodZ [Scopulibacillus daqui]